jgi:hypothetical protein
MEKQMALAMKKAQENALKREKEAEKRRKE